MLSKNKLKYVRSLSQKKYRDADQVFIAEGPKVVCDLQDEFECKLLIATSDFLDNHADIHADEVIVADQKDIDQASALKSPREVIAVYSQSRQPKPQNDKGNMSQNLELALDGVQDPGNLGTIIRIADWFGIRDIYCSRQCADVFSSKVIQATMGAVARVRVHYVDLVDFVQSQRKHVHVFGTFLDGSDIYQKNLHDGGLIIMGNEGNGISSELAALVTDRLYIPNYPAGTETSESLNVAVATAITCAEFRRQS